MEHRVRRAEAGTWHDHPQREQRADEGFWYHVANQLPSVLPEGARVIARWQENWDGGPGLVTRIAVTDAPLPAAWPRGLVAVAEPCVVEARARLVGFREGWDASPSIVTCTWFDGELDRAAGAASDLPDDALSAVISIVAELSPAAAFASSAPRLVAAGAAWRSLAADGQVFPDEIDDPYGTFGPGGPPSVPASWRGREVAQVRSPFEPLIELHEAGVDVLALGRDEVVVHRR